MNGDTIRRYIVYVLRTLLVILPFIWTSTTSELFEFPKMLTVYVFTGIVTALWLTRSVLDKKIYLAKTYLDIPLFLFFVSQLISTVLSIDVHTSVWGYYSRFHGGLVSTICYLLLYYATVTNLKREDVRTTISLLMASSAVAALYAFFEHFGGSASCVFITGNFNVDCWVQDVQNRVFGTFGQPNWLAAYIIAVFFIPLSFALQATSLKMKRAAWSVPLALLLFLTLLFTKSRSGLVGLAIGLIMFIPLTLFLYRTNLKQIGARLVTILLSLFTAYWFFGSGIIPQLDQVLKFGNKTDPSTSHSAPSTPTGPALEVGGTESGKIREIVWTGAVDLWKKYPLFGSGVETFAYSYYNVRPLAHNTVSEWDFLYNKAHNEFLNFLSTTGIVGLLSYLSIILTYSLWTLKTIFISIGTGYQEFAPKSKHKSHSKRDAGMSRFTRAIMPPEQREGAREHVNLHAESQLLLIAFLSGYLALAVSNFFGFSTVPVGLLFFLFPALTFGIHKSDILNPKSEIRNYKPKTMTAKSQISTSQKILITIIVLTLGYWLWVIGSMYQADLAYNKGKKAIDGSDLALAITSLQKAISLREEPLYYDSLSLAMAQAAIAFHEKDAQSEQAKQFAQSAVQLSREVTKRNKVHLNFYKSQVRTYLTLAPINPAFINDAQASLITALRLAPTDAKLWYNLGLLYDQLNKTEQALSLYQQTITMKPNYESARMNLAALYEESKTATGSALAREQYEYILNHINPNSESAQQKLQSL